MKIHQIGFFLLSLLLLAACSTAPEKPEVSLPIVSTITCPVCRQSLPEDQFNADFNLCLSCAMEAGAAYCQGCSAPCYTKDMVQGLCPLCTSAIPDTPPKPDSSAQDSATTSQTVICSSCGHAVAPHSIIDNHCISCRVQDQPEESTPAIWHCSSCGRDFDTTDNLYEGKCWTCYNEGKDLCVSCRVQPSDGLGPSGMECSDCYDQHYTTCSVCGYDHWRDDLVDGRCSSCNTDPLPGTFYSNSENVQIIITPHEYVDYIMTYVDLTSGTTLKNIPLSYYNVDTPTEKSLMFHIEDSYPEYEGYVELLWSSGAYCYNALIEGLEDTGGYYSTLTKD